jgi:hypothetical protein
MKKHLRILRAAVEEFIRWHENRKMLESLNKVYGDESDSHRRVRQILDDVRLVIEPRGIDE